MQFGTDTASPIIVGVDVTNQGTDHGLMTPMIEQIEDRTGQRPQDYLADGGTKLYVPVKDVDRKRKKGIDPFVPLPSDTPQRAEWRQRMGTEAAKQIYNATWPRKFQTRLATPN